MSEGKSANWGFALALAAAGVIAGAAGGARTPASPSGSAAPATSSSSSSAATAAPASRYEGMGARLLALSMGDTAIPAPPLADTALGVIVATIPDPIDSHEDWVYDGFLEALRRAHERMGYVVDRMWLPWTARADSVLDDGARTRVREAHPGVLVFRSLGTQPATREAPRYRVVYLVGEVPTAGVHPRALRQALAEREQLLGRSAAAAAETLAVVGPTFSGSSRGLAALLAEWRDQAPKTRTVSVATGSATGRVNRLLFERAGARFRSTVNSDETLIRVLERQVLSALWIERGELAILVEGSTYGQELERQEKTAASGSGYAAAPAKAPRDRPRSTATAAIGALKQAAKRAGEKGDARAPLRISFPLNIGTLREQYAGNAAAAREGDAAAQPGVSFTLTDAARPMESPPVTSALTAASVDLMLDDMARTLRTREIRAVAIAASDVRDRLFLASELRKRLRDMQFVVFEANGLYLAPQYNEALRGMIVLSSYPLLAETQMWSGSRLVVPFPFDHAEALYNATLLQLGREGETRLVDYALPDGRVHPQAPPVWISVVGGSGLIPLGVGRGMDPYVTHMAASRAQPARPDARIDFVWGIVILGVALLTARLVQLSVRHLRAIGAEADDDRAMLGAECVAFRGVSGDQRTQLEVFRWAQWGSLRYQEALYRFLLTVAAVGGLLPPTVLVFAAAAYRPGWGWQTATMALTALTAVGMLLAVRNSAVALAGWWKRHRGHFGPRMRACCGAWDAWRLNVYGRRVVLALGVLYLVLTLAYVVDVAVCAATDPFAFTLLFLRAWRIDGGMSPVLPLALAASAFLAWAWWHLRRLRALRGNTAFEAACLGQDPLAALQDVDAGDGPVAAEDVAQWGRAIPPRVVRGVRQVRERLFRLVPHRNALWLAAVLLLACGLVAVSRYRAPENVAGFHPLYAFDAVYRLGLAGMVAAIGWGVYRLLVVWSSLSRMLQGIAGTPLVTAFERLPQRVARLTRLTFVGAPRSAVVAPVAATQWRHLHSLAHALQPAPAAAPAGTVAVGRIVGAPAEVAVAASAFAEAPRAVAVAAPRVVGDADAPNERAAAEAELRRMALRYTSLEQPSPGLARWCSAEAAGSNFLELARVLEKFWEMEPATDVVGDVKSSVAKEVGRTHAGPSTSGRIRRTFSSELGLWARAAEEYAAVQVVDYIEWVITQIRVLALFLFAALLALVLHEAAYPYQPQSLVKLILFVLLMVTVGAVLKVMVGMNRDDVLSRIAGTEPGKVTWDRTFIVNALIFGLVPLFTLVSSEFPVVRSVLFAWIYPIARMLGGGG
ncbi:MAG TPA: hypothetical protein VFS20_05470 [Longimicrobium sp.]|nr:hypothetical protein [Longimicrobium sp.]